MKKIKILSALMALLLCASTLFVSCDNSKKENLPTVNAAEIMNKSWTADAEKNGVITGYSEINFKGAYNRADGIFIITTEVEPSDNSANTYKKNIRIYNVNTTNEILTLNDTQTVETKKGENYYDSTEIETTVENHIDAFSDEYFAVLTIKKVTVDSYYGSSESLRSVYTSDNFNCSIYDFNEDEADVDDTFINYTLTIYNASGTIARTIEHDQFKKLCSNNIRNFDYTGYNYGQDENGNYVNIAYAKVYNSVIERYFDETDGGKTYANLGLIVKGGKVYKTSKDAEPKLIKDFGLTKAPNFSNLSLYGDFYFESYSRTYTVYDKDLNKVFEYSAPLYEDGESQVFFLANGNLLVQTMRSLDQFAEKYDYRYGAENKFDITTTLVSKDGVTELEKTNYVFSSIEPSLSRVDGQKYYADSVENIAKIYTIAKDKTINMSAANTKIVTLSNSGEILAEVVVPDQKIVDFPIPVTDDIFSVTILNGGKYLFNDNGENQSILSTVDTTKLIDDKHILIENDAIYNLKGEKVYDFKANSATYTKLGNSLFITAIDDNGSVKYTRFSDGNFNDFSNSIFEFSSNGYYIIENEEKTDKETKKTYTYYNEKGDVIGTFESKLSYVGGNEDYLLLTGYALDTESNSNVLKTYKFTITK